MGIVIGADFVATPSNEKYFIDSNKDAVFGKELSEYLIHADYKIFNLEVPLTNKIKPIAKFGPSLYSNPESINLYRSLGVDLLTLGNNHIMDQGEAGLKDTVAVLDNNSIKHIGAGLNAENAKQPIFFDYFGRSVGVFACTEHEFSVATSYSAGANPFDFYDTQNALKEISLKADYVIVLYHGGKEQYRYPSPDLQKRCRFLIDNGANIVICQHSHCIGCEEKYNSGVIVYGQGNFLFDLNDNDYWSTSLLIEIDEHFRINYVPLCKEKNFVRLATGSQKSEILNDFYNRSNKIIRENYIEEEYSKYAVEKIYDYLWNMSGASNSKILRTINRLSGYKFYKFYVDVKYKPNFATMVLNYLECESHRELVINGLKSFYNNKNNLQ